MRICINVYILGYICAIYCVYAYACIYLHFCFCLFFLHTRKTAIWTKKLKPLLDYGSRLHNSVNGRNFVMIKRGVVPVISPSLGLRGRCPLEVSDNIQFQLIRPCRVILTQIPMWQTGNICKGKMLILTAESLRTYQCYGNSCWQTPIPLCAPIWYPVSWGGLLWVSPRAAGLSFTGPLGSPEDIPKLLQRECYLSRVFPDWDGWGRAWESPRVVLNSRQGWEPL